MIADKWIADSVPGKTFADVGGLWGTVNEKVTIAGRAGASQATMIDITPLDTALWHAFDERCAQENVSGYRCIQADVNQPDLKQRVGTYDVVYCSGVLYHCPNPMHTIVQLASICAETLIVTTTIIPEVIENARGRLVAAPGSAIFVPAMADAERDVVTEYLAEVGGRAIGVSDPLESDWSPDDFEPWWWLFTESMVPALLGVAGFKVSEVDYVWGMRVAMYYSRRTARSSEVDLN